MMMMMMIRMMMMMVVMIMMMMMMMTSRRKRTMNTRMMTMATTDIKNTIYKYISIYFTEYITYLPHKAVAAVSKDKEPIGRECAEFNWFESQLMLDSNKSRFK